MKKSLVGLFALLTLVAQNAFAACPCSQESNPCDTPAPCEKQFNPCETNKCTGEDWLSQSNIEEYFSRMNLDQAQRCEAMNAIENFRDKTEMLSSGECATKCDCRAYRHALKDLDCEMKKIITACQKSDYRSVRNDVKAHVRCTHKCLINPFTRCASCNNPCD